MFAAQSTQDRIIAYAAVSALYFASINPLIALIGLTPDGYPALRGFLVYALIPLVIGLVWALIASRGWLDPAWRLMGLRVLHNTPNSWDYAFGVVGPDTFIVATLRNGMQIAGKYGEGSFASTDPSERDILIGEVWNLEDGTWTEPSAPKSILLCGRDVQTVEFFKPTKNGESDEQK